MTTISHFVCGYLPDCALKIGNWWNRNWRNLFVLEMDLDSLPKPNRFASRRNYNRFESKSLFTTCLSIHDSYHLFVCMVTDCNSIPKGFKLHRLLSAFQFCLRGSNQLILRNQERIYYELGIDPHFLLIFDSFPLSTSLHYLHCIFFPSICPRDLSQDI